MQWSREVCGWLVSDQGRDWLERAAVFQGSDVQRASALRKDLSAEQASAVLEQLELRARAKTKFLRAEDLFFTRIGLEQATDSVTAAYKTRRFAEGTRVADLCCGIGGDFIALAAKTVVIGVDRDPACAIFAAANLAALGLPGQAVCESIQAETLDVDAWHIDPDRRPGGKRSVQLELHEPGLAEIESLRRHIPASAIKLAPAAEPPLEWNDRVEREWISRGGECKQLVVWCGGLAHSPGSARATVLTRPLETPSEQAVLATFAGERGVLPALTEEVGRFLYEPDAAVLAADLSGALAIAHELAAVAPGVAYFTSDQAVHDRALASFEVLEVMPYREAAVKSWLAERGIGRLEIKKRGVDVAPEALRKRLRLAGDQAAVLLLFSRGGKTLAVLARRVASTQE